MRRVVVTGMGITSALGSTIESAFERLKTYKNCVRHWDKLDEYEKQEYKNNTSFHGIGSNKQSTQRKASSFYALR